MDRALPNRTIQLAVPTTSIAKPMAEGVIRMFGSKAAKIGVRALSGVTAAAVLTLAITGSSFAASRNAHGAGACKDGGWVTAQADNGSSFRSETSCLIYVRFGGMVWHPSFVFQPSTVGLNQDAWMHVTGFHPNDTGTLTEVTIGGPQAGSTFSFLNVPLNSMGNMAVISTVFTVCDGTVGSAWTFTDSHGLHASANVYVSCAS
jgi:hypothetical protein